LSSGSEEKMAGYTEHDKIAEIAGISLVISEKINRFMNDMNPPEEFEDHNTERKIFVCGHLNVSIENIRNSLLSDKYKASVKDEKLVKQLMKKAYELSMEAN
jgi:hypothetical protein